MTYILCIIVVSVSSIIAGKYNNKKALFFTAFILSVFCGLRGIGVGVDTIHYYNFLSYIRGSGIGFGSDIGFSVISYILMGIFKNPHTPLLIYSFITNYLIVYRLWDFKEKASFPVMILIYVIIHYPYTFNIVRQFLAISIVFWATRYIERDKYIKYIILNVIATTFHTSSLLCFGYLFVKVGFETKKKKYRYLGIGLAIIFILVGLVLFTNNVQKYEQYFIQTSTGFHAMTILKIFCTILIIFFNKIYKNTKFSISEYREYVSMNKEIVIIYQLGLLLAGLGMFFTFMNRIGFYFLIYEMPFWGQVVRAVRNKDMYRILIGTILIYIIIAMLLFDTSGLIAYSTYF